MKYINKETGEVFDSFYDANCDFEENYDGNDDTNVIVFSDIYKPLENNHMGE